MNRQEMEQHLDDGIPFSVNLETVNKCVGLIALLLPVALLCAGVLGGSCAGINSISHYYYTRIGGDILVGALFVIGALLLFFYWLPIEPQGKKAAVDGNLGINRWDLWALRCAGLCAFGVALFPTSDPGCETFSGNVVRVFLANAAGTPPSVSVNGDVSFDFWQPLGSKDSLLSSTHYVAAAGMFLVLAHFCLVVFPRPQSARALAADGRMTKRKQGRNLVYRACGALICVAIAGLACDFLFIEKNLFGWADQDAALKWDGANLTFWFEALALISFGVAWSVKGRVFAIFRDPDEPRASATARI